MNGEREDEMQQERSRFIDFLIDGCTQPSEAFCEEMSLTAFILYLFFADKFPNMILPYSLKSSLKRTPETLNKCTFFLSAWEKKAIPQKQEI